MSLIALSSSAGWGCSDAASDGPDAPPFTGVGEPGRGARGSPAAFPSTTPSTPSPTPAGAEEPPATGGLDTSGAAAPGMVGAAAPGMVGAAAPGMVGASPAPDTPATPPAEAPAAEENPAPAAGPASAGCGVSQGIPQNPDIDSTIVAFPPLYNGSTPVPLVFVFHGANRTNQQQREDDSQTIGSDLERNYVMAFVKSAGTAWDLATDYPRFQAIRTQILSQLCIDTEHVFAFGQSSGAQFIVQMLGDSRARETGFAAIAPVSSSRYPNPAWSPVPTLLIHGLNDTARPGDNNGAMDISQYVQSNQCSGGTTELAVPTCSSIANRAAVNPGCVEYRGCAAPTLFCNHDDPNYIDANGPTNHGWALLRQQRDLPVLRVAALNPLPGRRALPTLRLWSSLQNAGCR
jgi:polyhydroxybutyrate depolymerase